MTPRDIILKHISRMPEVRIRETHRVTDAIMKELKEFDFIIIERQDLMKDLGVLRSLYCNRPTHTKDQ